MHIYDSVQKIKRKFKPLVEVGFITNSVEAQRLVKSSYQKKIALGLANGIENYFLNN